MQVGDNLVGSGGGPGYLSVQEWAGLLLSFALAAVRIFMVAEF